MLGLAQYDEAGQDHAVGIVVLQIQQVLLSFLDYMVLSEIKRLLCSCSVVCKCKLNLDIRAFTRKKVSQKKNRRHTPIAKILGFIE